MQKNKRAIHHMTWREVEAAFKEDPVVILPLGSMEEHGPHSLTGDFMAATAIAEKVAEQVGAYYLPTVPFGNSEYFRGYPGTISLSQETVISLLDDICRSLIEHGITKIMFFNGHAGNAPAIDNVARKVRREDGVAILSMDLWQMLNPEQKKEVYGEGKDPSGHGGEPLSSMMSYLYPDDMRMDLLPTETGQLSSWKGFEIDGLTKLKIGESKINTYLNMEDISPEGIMGDPYKASAERGEKIINYIVEVGNQVVKSMQQSDMVTKKSKK
ncbi:creatininase family protein [Planococcus sp. X10-3]|uniref:creatininase family protein n=1 Tax=Planococcus sp. X10-3 TaxID=3061240 RepID=UPI003BB04F0E